jgi:aspartyl-tRNA(Asn)/glutamyl-tRNA(Gln) amidotransferase subunit A
VTDLTLAEAGDRLARGEVSASELLEQTLARLRATEPFVHAFATVTEVVAREQAEQADRELAAGRRRGPLHGIPVAVKDLCHTRGIPTEAGSRVLAGFVPGADAAVVARLREAGAVLVGKTVTHEFAYGQNVPPTRNAWKLDSYPGGSSAGSAVAVAVGSAYGAIGTDTGGSIRIPAALNGVVGLKPTYGRISRRGVVPMSATLDTVGPIARTTRDCALLLGAIAGAERGDPTAIAEPVPDYAAALQHGVDGLRIGIERRFFFHDDVDPAVRSAVETALGALEQAGAELVEVEIAELDLATSVGVTVVMADTSEWHHALMRSRSALYDPGTRVMLEAGELVTATSYVRAQRLRTTVQAGIRRAFESHRLDALASPTTPRPAMPVDELAAALGDPDADGLSLFLRHCIIANVIGAPALSVPCGFSDDGLPVGLQLLGRPFGEETLLRIGHAYETLTDWHERRAALPVAS